MTQVFVAEACASQEPLPSKSKQAAITSAPRLLPVYVNWAWPHASVMEMPEAVLAPMTVKEIGAFGTRLPSPSRSVAVTVCVVPAGFSAVAGSSVIEKRTGVAPGLQFMAGWGATPLMRVATENA